jgi:hypothetical protein
MSGNATNRELGVPPQLLFALLGPSKCFASTVGKIHKRAEFGSVKKYPYRITDTDSNRTDRESTELYNTVK